MRGLAIVKRICMAYLFVSLFVCQADEGCSGTAYEQGPKIISSLEPLKQVARSEGHSRLVFRLRVTESGSVRDVIGTYPAHFMDVKKLKEQILNLKFCPAVKYSRYTAADIHFDIQIR
jgi:hypothetical protein